MAAGPGEALLVAVAALAHGYAVFLLDKLLGPLGGAVETARRQVEVGVRSLLG